MEIGGKEEKSHKVVKQKHQFFISYLQKQYSQNVDCLPIQFILIILGLTKALKGLSYITINTCSHLELREEQTHKRGLFRRSI